MRRWQTVVELSTFSKRASRVWSIEELDEFIEYIAGHPEAGDVVLDASGVRKIRWSSHGRGKRGGARIIYFFHSQFMPLFLLDFYSKNQKSDLSAQDRQSLRAIVQTLLKGN